MGKRRSSFVASDDSGVDERPAKITKKTKKSSSSGGAEADANGDPFWEVRDAHGSVSMWVFCSD